MIIRILGMILLVVMAACAPTTDTTSGTSPTSANTSGNSNGSVPTREGVDNSGEDITGDPGSGFGLGDAGNDGGFIAELTGGVSESLSQVGIINCENDSYVIRGALDAFPQISLILPQGASPGTFTLVNNTGDGTVATASVFFADGSVYAANVDGILIVNDLATQAGQPVSGSFDFSASSGSNSINASGEFNFTSSVDAVYCS